MSKVLLLEKRLRKETLKKTDIKDEKNQKEPCIVKNQLKEKQKKKKFKKKRSKLIFFFYIENKKIYEKSYKDFIKNLYINKRYLNKYHNFENNFNAKKIKEYIIDRKKFRKFAKKLKEYFQKQFNLKTFFYPEEMKNNKNEIYIKFIFRISNKGVFFETIIFTNKKKQITFFKYFFLSCLIQYFNIR